MATTKRARNVEPPLIKESLRRNQFRVKDELETEDVEDEEEEEEEEEEEDYEDYEDSDGAFFDFERDARDDNSDKGNRGNKSSDSTRGKSTMPLSGSNSQMNRMFSGQEEREIGSSSRKSVRHKASSNTNKSPEQSYKELKIKYQNLKDLRVTEAEKNLEDCRQKLKAATQNAEDYRLSFDAQLEVAQRNVERLRIANETLNAKVRSLQLENRELTSKVKRLGRDVKSQAKAQAMDLVLSSPVAVAAAASSRSVAGTGANNNAGAGAGALAVGPVVGATLLMYENLTGLCLNPQLRTFKNQSHSVGKGGPSASQQGRGQDSEVAVWDCRHSGPYGTLHFRLKYDQETVSYTPLLDPIRDKELLPTLPSYLTEEIEFEREYEAKLFWRILNNNHTSD